MNVYKISILLTTFILHCENIQVEVKSFSFSQVNDWADLLIEGMQREILSTDNVFIALPDLQAEATRSLGKVALQFEIFARKGLFGGLVPLTRKKNVIVSTINDEKMIELVVELTKTGAYFDDCIVQCGSTKSLHELEILVSPTDCTTVTIQLTVQFDNERCDFVVNHVRVQEFKNLTIAIDNQCVINENQMFMNWVIDYFNSQVCSAIGFRISTALSKLLKDHNICRGVKRV